MALTRESQLPKDPVSTCSLVPRLRGQGYDHEQVETRRRWIEAQTGASLAHVGESTIPTVTLRGNIENPIGVAQIPLGVAGPLLVRGEHAQGRFYVPLATTEGALVRSYERGMVTLTRAGGAVTRVHISENRISPTFVFEEFSAAQQFARRVPLFLPQLRAAADATTNHGRLLSVEGFPLGREVIVSFCFDVADAHGMNMIMRAADEACRWLIKHCGAQRYLIVSGCSSEKRAGASLLRGGKGKKVNAAVSIPAELLRSHLRVTPEQMLDMWRHTVLGHLQAGVVGYNGHFANGLSAIFIACGQDVANVANSAVGILNFEVTRTGDLHASVMLPSLTVATVGGGTALGTSKECLSMLGCFGSGRALKFAEIVCATILAGELSMGAAIASGEIVAAHETYGRNRPS